MNEKYSSLFTPFKIGNVTIKNRIVMCPMGGTSLFGWMKPNHFNKVAAEFFMEKAKNNVGLIIPGIAPLRDPIGNRWLYQNKKMFKELKPYMDEIHQTGAKLFVQLTAGFGRSFAITNSLVPLLKYKPLGVLASPIVNVSRICASPSVLPSRWAEDVKVRALKEKEIKKMIEAFAKTAKLCKDAGVDGVEVHAVHEGYLLDQFTLPYTNFRTDQYGGSFENRYRFAVEVVQKIKEVCGQDYPVSLRYSVVSKTKGFCSGAIYGETDFKEVGRDMKESEKAAKYLQDAGYDMLNCDNGTYDAWYWSHPPMYMPENCNLDDVAHIKKFVDIPVVCAGRMSLDVASQAIKENKIDGMGVARQFLVDGKWVTKVLEDRLEDIQPCICCHNACFPLAHYKGAANDEAFDDVNHMSRCALNPQTMQGHKYDIKEAKVKKKVAIIGGGIGGMEAARIATLRGHDVTIYEKSNVLGGVFIDASNFAFKEKDKELINWYRRQVNKLGIKVKFNTEIKDVNSLDADEVIIATGAKPRLLKGKGYEKAIDAVTYLKNKNVGEKVLIIGGGLTGCEIAYELKEQGKTPIIVEMKQDLMAIRGLCLANSSYLRDYFKYKNVEVHLLSKVKEINGNEAIIVDNENKESKVQFDDIIVSIGYTPNPIVAKGKHIHLIGDANRVGNLRSVIWDAWKVAEKI
ncbi:MAG: FAD-dependent oxidoreductase [Bacilli bacterium]|nr:FAD-dependent oxidoreductase [Bacilli bacterium]